MTTTGSYTQDFNTLRNIAGSGTWTDNSTIANWYSQRSGSGTSITTGTGSANAGDLYSFGIATGNTERALGSVGSGNAAAGNFAHGLLLRNTSGGAITSLSVAYTGEQWRAENVAAHTMTFWYKISSSSITALNPNANGTWTAVTALNFTGPRANIAATALDGNSATNRTVISAVNIPSLSLANNEYIMLKWDDPDNTGADHGLAIDDVTVSWVATPPSPTITPTPTSLTGFTYSAGSGPSAAQSFTLAASGLTAGGGTITITESANYEVSTTSATTGFGTSATLTYTGTGTLASNTVWVRLKAGRTVGNYNGETIAISGGGGSSSVTVSGNVTNALFTSVANGDWNTAATWDLNAVPGSGDNVIINTAVTLAAPVTRNSGTTTTVNATRSLAIGATYTNNGTTTVNGIFQLNGGGYADGANDFVYATTGSYLIFNGSGTYNINAGQRFWPTASYPENVTVNPGNNISINDNAKTIRVSGIITLFGGMINNSGININGTLLMNQNGYVSVNSPVYGSASLLQYNTNTNPYNNALEWTPSSSPANVQLSGNTVLNYPNGGLGARTLTGNLTIDAGSALYMDYGSPGSSVGLLTVNNIIINGALSLGNLAGGDLEVKSNWTRTGTFSPNNRAVTFSGAALQSVTGATTFDYLTLNNSSGLSLANDVLVNQTLALTNGKIFPGSNTLTIASAGNITGASSANFVVTSGTGSLKRNAVGNIAKDFPIGNLSGSYTPLTIVNNGTVNDISVKSSATIDNAVFDATRIVTLQWNVTSSGAGTLADIGFNWNVANQAASYNASGTGELGNYTTGPYAITNIGTMAGQVKAVTGIALSSGTNKLVIGNTGAVYVSPPANDLCANAIALTINAAATNGTLVASTLTAPFAKKDVWYKFTATCSGSHTITVGAFTGDVDVEVFNQSGACPTTTTTFASAATSSVPEIVTNTGFTAGTTYFIRVLAFNTAAETSTFTIAVTGTITVPAQPGSISGNAMVCSGSSQSYSVVNDAAATSYTWTLPATWTGTSSVNSINTTAGTAGGNISVTANNGCGSSTPQTLAVTVNPTPAAPTAIAGTNVGSTTFTANWNAVPGATGYFVDVYSYGFATDLIISEYVEGSGNNKYVEIFNGTGATVTLSDYQLRLFANGAAAPTTTLGLTGTLAHGATLVIRDPSATIYGGTTTSSGVASFNGDDALGLWKISTAAYVDIFGRIGEDPGSAWTGGGLSTLDRTLVRNATVTGGVTTNPASGFPTLTTQWTGFATDNVANLGSHTFTGPLVYVPFYQNIYTTNTFLDVTGLNPNVTYYYVVRADNGNCTSANSNIIPVTTTACVATGITVNSFTPTSGPVATMVYIKGSGFSTTPVTNSVKFGEVISTSYTIVGDTMIVAEVPAGVAAVSKVRVANGSGCFSSSAGDFTLISTGGTCTMTDLIISEVYDPASGNDHYIEIYNGTNSTINLNTPNNYTIQIVGMPGASVGSFDITGTIAPGQAKVYYAGTNGGLATAPAQGYGSGFNADDSIWLSKNGVVIDKMAGPNNAGFDWRRSAAVTGPNSNYTASEWALKEEVDGNLSTSNIGSFTAGTDIAFTTHPLDQSCAFVMSVVATGTFTAYQWKYYEPSTDSWQNVTLANLPGTVQTGATGPVLTISGNIAPYYNYQFYCEVRNGSACHSASNAAQYNYFTKAYYKADVLTATALLPGEWTNPLTWLISDDNVTYVPACTYPLSLNSSYVIIPTGAYVRDTVNQQISIDKLTIETGGTVRFDALAGLKILNSQSGADFIVDGTFIDRMGTGSGNGLSFEDNSGTANDATWNIAAAGTLIKTNSASATGYRDFYETGIANIPATANWIYRHDTLTSFIAFAGSNASTPMYYPNLTLENTVASNTYASNFNAGSPSLSQFAMVGTSNTMNIKGNFDVGGSGPGFIDFLNANTFAPVNVAGNTIIRAGNRLTNEATATYSGQGLDLKGSLTVDGTLINNGGTNNTGMLRFSGAATQIVSGSGTMDLENADIANSGATGTGVDVQRNFGIPGVLSFAAGTPKVTLTSGIVTIKSSAVRTGQIAAVPAGASITYGSTGRFEIERYLPAYKAWRFVSTPVSLVNSPTITEAWREGGSTASTGYGTQITGPEGAANGFDATTTGYSMKWYNDAINNYTMVTSTSGLIANNTGYMLFVRGDRSIPVGGTTGATNLRIKGQIKTGDQPFAVNANNVQSIGNPYASSISMPLFLAAHPALGSSYIAWDPSLNGSYNAGGYQTISSLTVPPYQASSAGTAIYANAEQHPSVQSGQAFFVRNSTGSTLNGTITEAMKGSGSDIVSRENSPEDRQFLFTKLYSNNNEIADGNFVAFDDELSNDFDADDAIKFTNSGENFGMSRFGKKLSVEARNRVQASDTIHYNMSNLREQEYKVSLLPEKLSGLGMEAYFVDRFLNTQTPVSLAGNTDITISITSNAASKAANRFYLVFKALAGPLPVTFVSIAAQRQADRTIAVKWKVANEINIDHYEVERSANGTQFNSILTNAAQSVADYSKNDLSPLAADNFYRIKAVGIDGSITYSAIVKVSPIKVVASISVYPNPVVNGQLGIQFTGQAKGAYKVQLINAKGQLVYNGTVNVTGDNFNETIQLGETLAPGTYQLSVHGADGKITNNKVLIQ